MTSFAAAFQGYLPSSIRSIRARWLKPGDPKLLAWLQDTCQRLAAGANPRANARPDALIAFRLLELGGPGFPKDLDPLLLEGVHALTCAEDVSTFLTPLIELISLLPDERATPLLDALGQRAPLAALVGFPPWPLDTLQLLGPRAVEGLQRALAQRQQRTDLHPNFDRLPNYPSEARHLASRLRDPLTLLQNITTSQLLYALITLDHLDGPLHERTLGLLRYELERVVQGRHHLWSHTGVDLLGTVLKSLPEAQRVHLLTDVSPEPWRWFHLAATAPEVVQRAARSPLLSGPNATLHPNTRIPDALRALGRPVVPHLLARIAAHPRDATALLGHLRAVAEHVQPRELIDLLPGLSELDDLLSVAATLAASPHPPLDAIQRAWTLAGDASRDRLALILLATLPAHPLTAQQLRAFDAPDGSDARRLLQLAARQLDTPHHQRAHLLFNTDPGDLPHDPEDPRQPARNLLNTLIKHDSVRYYTQSLLDSGADFLADPHLQAHLITHPAGDLLAWHRILKHALPIQWTEALIKAYAHLLGERRLACGAAALLDATPDDRLSQLAPLVAWLAHQGHTTLEQDLRLLASNLLTLQEPAITALQQRGAQALPHLLTLLNASKAATRGAAARALERLNNPEALPALRDANKKEKSKNTKQDIQSAIDKLDPRATHPTEQEADLGAWTPEAPHPVQDLLAQLRDLLYLPPSPALRRHIFDLLVRLDLNQQAHLGVAYLLGHLDAWPEDLRVLPWGTERIEAFQPLLDTFRVWDVKTNYAHTTVTAFLLTPHWEPAATEALKHIEHGLRARKLSPQVAQDFLRVVSNGWRFCQRHHLPLDALDVRFDGGSARGIILSSSTATTLDLIDGFGVRLSRQPTRRTDEVEPAGLRSIRVTVPPRHPLRDRFAMKPRQRILDLSQDDLLNDGEQAP